ncbi:head completion/stabilization protein [Vibrio vulnificus]|uniref:head completion/stabilization protein n=1 Tax=Vibrio vulnificus TaxID=672 RepID=UPI001F045DB2|nr:head completion/stabilization protein [Vibrio vulnificus]EGR1512121.1 head completion/stabilization protein [Vibrio vulnificus]EIY8041243.1 head completion/stabilization protein [Vibrio vulnificus]MCG9651469.1 head completion/stabilization protein [Vibrio vulnificus]
MFTASNNSYQETKIKNDGFWPDIEAGDFERLRGTPAAQDDERIAHALVNAVSSVNLQLEILKARYMAEGIVKAEDINAFPKIEGKNRVVIQYQSSVFARAKADLLADFATVHQKKEGDHLAERSQETKNELLAESERIIRNMLGKNRASVELI